jgi:phospholipase C
MKERRMVFSSCIRATAFASAYAAILSGCAGTTNPSAPLQSFSSVRAVKPHATQAIQNIIVVLQQDRSFDNLFAGYPGADAPTSGKTHDGKQVTLRSISLKTTPECASSTNGSNFKTIYNDGKMNGWDLTDPKDPLCPYTRVARGDVAPYWQLARHYALGDHLFASTRFGDFANGLYAIAGTSKIGADTYAVGPPSREPWGCDAPPGTIAPVLKNGRYEFGGPFPCFTQFRTIADLLDAASVGWNVYSDKDSLAFDPFDPIKNVRLGPDWKNDGRHPASAILSDLSRGTLRPVSFVVSPGDVSDFPGSAGGPKWIAQLVKAAQGSKYWQHVAIVVTWTSPAGGRFYDNVPPPFLDQIGLGFRVPLLVISPNVKPGEISHTQYEFASILKFIETNWSLGSLGSTDERANSIGDMFDR